MWTAKEDQPGDAPGRSSTNSEVVLVDGQSLATSSTPPNVASLSVTKSSRVHIGPKFVSVTQNLQNTEVVKDMSCPVYVWHIIKNSSRAERLSCLAALVLLLTCVGLIVYFTVRANDNSDDFVDVAPHEWKITRNMWLSRHFITNFTTENYDPVKLVIIQHSVSPECTRFVICAAELRNLQSWFIKYFGYDIPYNFIIGNDGRVYEGRGWGIEGAHTLTYNRCSVGIGFIGDYREELPVHTRVTEQQLTRAKMIIAEGVRLGHIDPDYMVLGAKDLQDTASPGSNLYNAIRKWQHYGHSNPWQNSTCEIMHGMPPLETH